MSTFPVSIGERVYTTGDICNPSGWAMVKEIRITRWGTSVEVVFEPETLGGRGADARWEHAWIEMTAFTGTRKGTDRWQTEREYNAYRAARMAGT